MALHATFKSNWKVATSLFPEEQAEKGDASSLEKDTQERSRRAQVDFTCPLALEGDEATAASPGLSAAASPFAAVLENWAPMLASSTKKLNRSKWGNKEPRLVERRGEQQQRRR